MIIGFTGHVNIEECFGKILNNNGINYDEESYNKVYNHIEIAINKILKNFNKELKDITIVSGMARGVDEIAADFAINNKLDLILSIPGSIERHKNRSFSRGLKAQAIKYEEILKYKNIIKINEIKKEYGGIKYIFPEFARNKNIIDESDIVISYKVKESNGTNDAIKQAIKTKKYYGNIPSIIKKTFTPYFKEYSIKEKKKKYLINIVDRGKLIGDKGTYIGRPSIYQNPYSTKKSKFKKNIYPHKESMKLYEEKQLPKLKFSSLVKELKEKGEITISCSCINKTLDSRTFIKPENPKCHGELIANKIFKILNQELIEEKKEKRKIKTKKSFEFSLNKKYLNENEKFLLIQFSNINALMENKEFKENKKNFPKQFNSYIEEFKENGLKVGDIIYTQEFDNMIFSNLIIYQNTKINYRYLFKSLKEIKNFALRKKIYNIKIPLITDKNWGIIDNLIKKVFNNDNNDLFIQYIANNKEDILKAKLDIQKREEIRNSFSKRNQ